MKPGTTSSMKRLSRFRVLASSMAEIMRQCCSAVNRSDTLALTTPTIQVVDAKQCPVDDAKRDHVRRSHCIHGSIYRRGQARAVDGVSQCQRLANLAAYRTS